MSRLSGLGKRKIIADRRLWVECRRPHNKKLLIASGCFGMILTGFMSKNTPYNCKIKGVRAHINNCIGRISFVLQKLGREGDLCVEPLAQKFASSSCEILRVHWQLATRWPIPIWRIESPNAHDAFHYLNLHPHIAMSLLVEIHLKPALVQVIKFKCAKTGVFISVIKVITIFP